MPESRPAETTVSERAAAPEASRDVALRSGSTLRLREARSDDGGAIRALHDRLPSGSPYLRFFAARDADFAGGPGRLAAGGDCTLVGEAGGRIVAIARFFRIPDRPEDAEVAFVVEAAAQSQGIGTALLDRLAEIARGRGVRHFEADLVAGNRRMIEVFRNCGFQIEDRRFDAGVEKLRLDITPAPARAPGPDRDAVESMRRLFEPRVVAVIGASPARGKIGAEILHNLVERFRGSVVAINPKHRDVFGVPSFPRLRDVPGPVDLAVVAIPAAGVEAAVDECVAKGVTGIVIITAGFSETGDAGRRREAAIAARVRAAGIRLIGPNCMGILNTDPRFALDATFAPTYPPEGHVALSSQSGALGLALLDYAEKLNLGISTFVSVGNKADVSSNDLIQYWAEDPRTEVILLYLESFGNPARFARLARRVGRTKPIVAVKSGRSRSGSRAASSHTGAFAESDRLVDALFRQTGVIRTTTLEELFDVAMLLAHQPVPLGRRVAILTNAGGPGILAADACEAHGLELPPLSPDSATRLRGLLPPAASVSNPVDMLASAPPEHYRRAEEILLADPAFDSLLVIFIPPIAENTDAVAEAIVTGAGGARKPVLATFMSARGTPRALSPIPCYPFPESAAIALARATEYGAWRRRPAGAIPPLAGLDLGRARSIIRSALARGGGWLAPREGTDLLAAFGIASAKAVLASDETDAVEAARSVGFPVALKAVGPTILHKTEVGGVVLGLADEDGVHEACRRLEANLGDRLAGFLVQEMLGGVETIVGVSRDRTFGPLVLYGSGGTLVELLGDVAVRLHPLTDRDVGEMLDEVKGTARLRGYREAPRLDEDALKNLLLRVSALVEHCPEVREMDLNPVMVLATGVRVADARIRIERPPAA